MCWIYHHIDSLLTPCGEITVRNENREKCRFSVRKNVFCSEYSLFYGTKNEESIHTDTNYLLCIHTDDLVVGNTYKICLKGSQLHYGDSDEHTEAVSGSANGYSIAIGSYDPNDAEKICQALISTAQYDKSRFVQYDVEMLDDYSGFSFRLLENSVQEIIFPVAWVENECEGIADYEGAVEFWTT